MARAVGRDPAEIRIENMIPQERMPFTSVAGMRYDTGDYPASVRLCAELVDCRKFASASSRGEPDGRLVGVGFASFTEQTAHGAAEFASRGAMIIPGFESCTARVLTDGSLVLMVGIQSHGQGLETALSQVAYQELGINPAHISVRHGDTESTAFGFGTFASRSMVMSGGAVARASRILREKIERIGAHLLQCDIGRGALRRGLVSGPQGRSVTIAEIAKVAHLRMDGLPPDVEPLLDATATYEPGISTGVFSYATHGAVVAVDPETGAVELIDFAVAEDCGTMVNPMLVEGQIRGGVAQGIGTALYEEIPYDKAGPAARRDAARLPPAGRVRTAADPDRAPAQPGDGHRIRHEGNGRGRRRCAAGCDRERRARRACSHRCRSQRNPDHRTAGDGGDQGGRARLRIANATVPLSISSRHWVLSCIGLPAPSGAGSFAMVSQETLVGTSRGRC